MPVAVGVVLLFVLILGNGFFVALEFALVACDRKKLEALADDGSFSARAAVAAHKRLSFHLSGAQLGITVTSLILGFLADSLVEPRIAPLLAPVPVVSGATGSAIIALAVVAVSQMMLGELIPKGIAVGRPEGTSQALAPIAVVLHGAFSPVIRLFNGAANWIIRHWFGLEPTEELADLRSLEDLEFLIRTSGDEGAIKPDELALLTRTLRFGDKSAAEALTPRVHIDAIESTVSVDELLVRARDFPHSKLPVYRNDLDDIVGVVNVSNAFTVAAADRASTSVTTLMSEPLVVPETRDLIDIIDDFRTSQSQLAIVIDEHGGTAGLLSLEDVLEEIVGEIDDEYDETTALTVGVGQGVYLLAGTLHLDEVEEACGLELSEGEYETLAGYMLAEFGRIPEIGDQVAVETWRLQVTEMDRLRIASVRATKRIEQKPAEGSL